MGQKLILGFPVENLMVLVFPLLTTVFATDGRPSTCEFFLGDGNEVHVPDADEEVFEFYVLLEGLIEELVVLGKCRSRN